MEQIAKIQEQIENKPWKTAIAVFKNGKSYFENSLANTTYKSASLIKLAIIIIITMAIGNAAIIETDCRFAMLLSLKISAIGSIIKRIAQKSFILLLASS